MTVTAKCCQLSQEIHETEKKSFDCLNICGYYAKIDTRDRFPIRSISSRSFASNYLIMHKDYDEKAVIKLGI